MKWYIPPPLGARVAPPQLLAADHTRPANLAGEPHHADHVCRSRFERGDVATDLVIAASPGWIRYAVDEILAGRTPRTKAYVVPSLSGAQGVDLGRGALRTPMAFGGPACHPEGDGHLCDHATPGDLPEHPAVNPRRPRRPVVEDVGDVLLDDFDDGLSWPMIVVEGGEA